MEISTSQKDVSSIKPVSISESLENINLCSSFIAMTSLVKAINSSTFF